MTMADDIRDPSPPVAVDRDGMGVMAQGFFDALFLFRPVPVGLPPSITKARPGARPVTSGR
jgi:hypothetical protein